MHDRGHMFVTTMAYVLDGIVLQLAIDAPASDHCANKEGTDCQTLKFNRSDHSSIVRTAPYQSESIRMQTDLKYVHATPSVLTGWQPEL